MDSVPHNIQLATQIAILCACTLTIVSLLGCCIKQYYNWIICIIRWIWYLINLACVVLVFSVIILQSTQLRELAMTYWTLGKESLLQLLTLYTSIQEQLSK